jgi:hypothetical protein
MTYRSYITTIHMITSAIITLSSMMQLPSSRLVYRGLGGMALPSGFFWPDEYGCRGGTEAAFMSTTLDSTVAINYIRSLALPLVFELGVGQVDRGAEVSWCSQYPAESEVLFPPLCNLEVIGDPTIKIFGEGEDAKEVLVFKCNISVNLKSLSREELESRRHNLLVSSMSHTLQEIERDLDRQKETLCTSSTKPAYLEAEVDDMIRLLVEEVKTLIQCHRTNNPEDYNRDQRFHQSALQEAAMLPMLVLSKFNAWSKRSLVHPSNFNELSMQEWSVFFESERWQKYEQQVAIYKEQLARAPAQPPLPVPAELRRAALAVVELRGLSMGAMRQAGRTRDSKGVRLPPTDTLAQIEEGIDYQSNLNGSTALMRAVSNGSSVDVELLLHARSQIDLEDHRGHTALALSIILGEHEQQRAIALLLIQSGARLEWNGGTMLHIAARCGRVHHVQMLLHEKVRRGASDQLLHDYAKMPARYASIGV